MKEPCYRAHATSWLGGNRPNVGKVFAVEGHDETSPDLPASSSDSDALQADALQAVAVSRQRLNVTRSRITDMRNRGCGTIFREAARIANPCELLTKVADVKEAARVVEG